MQNFRVTFDRDRIEHTLLKAVQSLKIVSIEAMDKVTSNILKTANKRVPVEWGNLKRTGYRVVTGGKHPVSAGYALHASKGFLRESMSRGVKMWEKNESRADIILQSTKKGRLTLVKTMGNRYKGRKGKKLGASLKRYHDVMGTWMRNTNTATNWVNRAAKTGWTPEVRGVVGYGSWYAWGQEIGHTSNPVKQENYTTTGTGSHFLSAAAWSCKGELLDLIRQKWEAQRFRKDGKQKRTPVFLMEVGLGTEGAAKPPETPKKPAEKATRKARTSTNKKPREDEVFNVKTVSVEKRVRYATEVLRAIQKSGKPGPFTVGELAKMVPRLPSVDIGFGMSILRGRNPEYMSVSGEPGKESYKGNWSKVKVTRTY